MLSCISKMLIVLSSCLADRLVNQCIFHLQFTMVMTDNTCLSVCGKCVMSGEPADGGPDWSLGRRPVDCDQCGVVTAPS